jgi:PBP1b-binding outer membrane lipoprotein LpoB
MTGMETWKQLLYGVVATVLIGVLFVGGCSGAKAWERAQKRADANNAVKVTHILIRRAQQQAQIVHAQNAAIRAKAEQRVIEAEGIRKAQDLISATLTPLYVQHEAIKAQMNDRQGDRTYIPVGPQGVPLVANVNGDSVGPQAK